MGNFKAASRTLKHNAHDVNDNDYSDEADKGLRQHTLRVMLSPSGTASTEENFMLMEAEEDIELVSARYIPNAALTAHASNNATLDINKEDGAAGGLTSIDSITTSVAGTGNWAARVPEDFGGIVISDTLTAGEVLVLEITKGGTGVAVPAGIMEVVYRYT